MGEKPTPDGLLVVQELINTLDVETREDSLSTRDGLAELTRRHQLRLSPDDVPQVRRLREQLRAVCRAHVGAELPPADAAELNGWLAAAPLVLRVEATGAAALHPAPGLAPFPALVARIAVAIAAGEADGTWQRLKACASESCQWAYYDHSPAGRRRWCSMQACGTREKMRTYRARRDRSATA
ncbi:CGNR zinc finger domain-containing protein [Streptomyces sp. B6B3]|uniref:CGNR zinc finger domain-containing protein n=1 Tax=Streptomyces sp. B6B3 TaxID=3153570 RepID=UPI00325EEC6E